MSHRSSGLAVTGRFRVVAIESQDRFYVQSNRQSRCRILLLEATTTWLAVVTCSSVYLPDRGREIRKLSLNTFG